MLLPVHFHSYNTQANPKDERLCIDEQVVPYKGKSGINQYNQTTNQSAAFTKYLSLQTAIESLTTLIYTLAQSLQWMVCQTLEQMAMLFIACKHNPRQPRPQLVLQCSSPNHFPEDKDCVGTVWRNHLQLL